MVITFLFSSKRMGLFLTLCYPVMFKCIWFALLVASRRRSSCNSNRKVKPKYTTMTFFSGSSSNVEEGYSTKQFEPSNSSLITTNSSCVRGEGKGERGDGREERSENMILVKTLHCAKRVELHREEEKEIHSIDYFPVCLNLLQW